jgi:tripartite-type tricarboxylate transporter receptor subunit TctC
VLGLKLYTQPTVNYTGGNGSGRTLLTRVLQDACCDRRLMLLGGLMSTTPRPDLARRRTVTQLAFALGASLFCSKLWAQTGVFNRPIRIVFPYAPGGGPENILRLIAKRAEEESGATIIIDNRPGAGGTLGASAVKNAPRDGFTILLGDHATLAVNVALFKHLPYDPLVDFVPITLLFTSDVFLIVPSSLDVNSASDLQELGKRRAKGLTYGSPGLGSGGHIAGAMLVEAFGASATHVPYRGSAAVRTDILAGRLDFTFNSLQPYQGDLEAGTVRALAVASLQRAPSAGAIPTTSEVGYSSVVFQNWFGLLAPAATDRHIVDALSAMFLKAAQHFPIAEYAGKQGFTIRTMVPPEFASFIKQQIGDLGQVVRELKLDVQQ